MRKDTGETLKAFSSASSAFQGVLIHPSFRKRVKGCIVQSLQDLSKKYPFPVNTIFTLGRLELNDLFIDSKHVSRNHAKVEVREHQVVIIDTNSTNGTYINKDRITQKVLNDGDLFSISGKYNFLISIDTDRNNALRSLRHCSGCPFVDVVEDASSLFDFFREEFGEQVLLEVERQTNLFCSEFEALMKSKDHIPPFSDQLQRLLQLLSNAVFVKSGNDSDDIIAEHPDLLIEGMFNEVKKLATRQNRYHIVYFEIPDLKEEEKLLSNGFLISLPNGFQFFVSDIPYENLIYMLYASHWFSQLSEAV